MDSEVTEKWVNTLISQDVLFLLARGMGYMDIQGFVASQKILSFLIRWKPTNYTGSLDTPVVKHMVDTRPEITYWLCRGYDSNTAKSDRLPSHSGKVLREAIKFESVALTIFYNQSLANRECASIKGVDMSAKQTGEGLFWQFFEWINKQTFEVAADCFNTFKVYRPSTETRQGSLIRTNRISSRCISRSLLAISWPISISSLRNITKNWCCPSHMSPNVSPSNSSGRSCWTVQTTRS